MHGLLRPIMSVRVIKGEAPIEAPTIPEPTLVELVLGFSKAMAKWVASGRPVVSREILRDRLKACRGCEFWAKRSLFAKCRKCGCRKLKLWMATEQCPLPEPEKRWKAI